MGTASVALPSSFPRFKVLLTSRIRCGELSETTVSRKRVLEEVDEKLALGDERAALALVKGALGKPGGLACFGAARQVPQRLYTLDELRLNGIETSSLLSPVDTTLGAIERSLQLAAIAGGLSAGIYSISVPSRYFIFPWHCCSSGHSMRFLSVEEFPACFSIQLVIPSARNIIIGLFKGYTISSLDALQKEGSLNVQAGTSFVDFEFLEEVNAGKVSASMLNRFSCIALAGVATEYLLFGCAEGGIADINKLDVLLKGLGFTQKKADSQVRWSGMTSLANLADEIYELMSMEAADLKNIEERLDSMSQLHEESSAKLMNIMKESRQVFSFPKF
ncbi:hypothetical protein MLD38_039152 [Melastoma candidum]|uniref:Uncharacterized protein n=1 Tax=Melastoma candidum TaxID=119954 RepID=A0ACB9L2I5_9MYRT|nr:hypothetical protein MLD38_039152 [Melastoma candidum]